MITFPIILHLPITVLLRENDSNQIGDRNSMNIIQEEEQIQEEEGEGETQLVPIRDSLDFQQRLNKIMGEMKNIKSLKDTCESALSIISKGNRFKIQDIDQLQRNTKKDTQSQLNGNQFETRKNIFNI